MAYQSKLETHYRNLCEIYQIEYNNQIEVAEALMVLHGISVEMMSECLNYAIKNKGHNQQSKKSKNRVEIMMSKLKLLSSIQSDNYALNLINKKNIANLNRLRAKVAEYEKFYQEQKILINENLNVSPEKIT